MSSPPLPACPRRVSCDRMSDIMSRMEERGRNQEATLVAMEKDLALKQQAMDTLRAKVGA